MKYIVSVRGMLKNAEEAKSQAVHDATIAMIGEMGRSMGNIGHRAYLNPQNRREFMAIDTWDNIEGPQKLLSNPDLATEFGKLFDGMPQVVIWAETEWAGW